MPHDSTADDMPEEGVDQELLAEEGVEDVDESAEQLRLRYAISSYGADFTVDSLVRRMNNHDIFVPTFDPVTPTTESGIEGFQRGVVWTKRQMNRFIESLLLGLPVPGIFLVAEPDGRLLVLDGQQRLRTLQDFYNGFTRNRPFALASVDEQFAGLGYSDLLDPDRRRLDNTIIHATIVKEDDPSDDKTGVYMIFERLNTGATQLTAQEIRVALFRGPLLNVLRELNETTAWRRLYGPPSKRLKDQELILRFFAMLESASDYKRPLKEFLSDFMGRRNDIGPAEQEEYKSTFVKTCDLLLSAIGTSAFRPGRNLNAAVAESVLVGVAKRLQQGPVENIDRFKKEYEDLLEHEEYKKAIERSTSNEEFVALRLDLATAAFGAVG